MLEDAIAISKKTLDEHDFEADGVEVSLATQLNLKPIWRIAASLLN